MIDEIWCFRKYDYFGFRVAPGETVIDIGAHIGAFTVYAATVCRASRVFAFEPHPDNFRMLTRNVAANNLTGVTAINEAVAGKSGSGRLQLHASNSGGHRLTTVPGSDAISVKCVSLEEVLSRFGIERADYVKIDCEGAEYDILLNTPPEVMARIGRISMEYHRAHRRDVEELTALLARSGFDLRSCDGHRLYARHFEKQVPEQVRTTA
jgi:FkbM family methyltransferase